MKISIITSPFHELPPTAIGAVEKLFYLLAGEWVKLGNKIVFICCGGGDDTRIQFIRLKKYQRTGSIRKDIFWDFIYSVKALWKCPKTDILLCNTFWTPVLAPFFRWKYKRLVYGVHRYPKGQFRLYPFAHAFICVSTAVADALKSQLRTSERVFTIVNPIEESIFNRNIPRQPIKGRVLYAGRIHPAKGLVCLAKACRSLYTNGRCVELVLIGAYEKSKGGGGEDFVSKLRDIAGPCPIVLTGPISNPNDLAALERTAQVFVYPSEDMLGEACPIAPMEAMALGVPTVVSNMACYMDYVTPDMNAWCFVVGDNENLMTKLSMLMSDDSICSKIGESASNKMLDFTPRKVAEKYIAVFNSLIGD